MTKEQVHKLKKSSMIINYCNVNISGPDMKKFIAELNYLLGFIDAIEEDEE